MHNKGKLAFFYSVLKINMNLVYEFIKFGVSFKVKMRRFHNVELNYPVAILVPFPL